MNNLFIVKRNNFSVLRLCQLCKSSSYQNLFVLLLIFTLCLPYEGKMPFLKTFYLNPNKVFQRRNRGATSFYNNWMAYKNGFGDNQDEFWLGNDKLHYLTKQGNYEIRIDFISSSNSAWYAKYSLFRIDSGTNKYRVTHIGSYSGNGGM